MRILITGASGLIGSHLGAELARAGHELITLTRRPRPDLPFRNTNFAWPHTTTTPPASALDAIDAVVNLAGEPIADKRWTAQQKHRIRHSRVDTTTTLMRAFTAAKQPPTVWINASAIGYYGSWRGDELLIEDSPPGTGFLGETCQAWENATVNELETTRKVLLRIGIVLSDKGGFLGKLRPVFRAGLGGQVGNGQQWLSWIHIDDLAHLIMTAIDDPRYTGVFNAVAPQNITNAVFTKTFAGILRRPAFLRVPTFVLKLVLGDMSELAIGGQRVSVAKLQKLGFTFLFPNLEDALRALVIPATEDSKQNPQTQRPINIGIGSRNYK